MCACTAGLHGPGAKGKRTHQAVPRASSKTISQDCAPKWSQSWAPAGRQSPFTALQLQQSDCSYLRQAQGYSISLTATCLCCRATNFGWIRSQAILVWAELYRCNSDQTSLDQAALQNPAMSFRCNPVYLPFSGKHQDILSVWDPITASNLTVL